MMNKEELSNVLLHYGRQLTDIQFVEDCGNIKFNVRVRNFAYNGHIFFHHMVDGEVVECFELK